MGEGTNEEEGRGPMREGELDSVGSTLPKCKVNKCFQLVEGRKYRKYSRSFGGKTIGGCGGWRS